MIKKKTFKIEGPILFNLPRFKDSRGYFEVNYNNKEILKNIIFVQDNLAFSKKNVLRGLHFQKTKPQGKLIKVLAGKIIDYVVDIRSGSSSFGEHIKVELCSSKNQLFWIPRGFAHGYISIKNENLIQYKVDQYWYKNDEKVLNFFDPKLKIELSKSKFKMSDKDKLGSNLYKLFNEKK